MDNLLKRIAEEKRKKDLIAWLVRQLGKMSDSPVIGERITGGRVLLPGMEGNRVGMRDFVSNPTIHDRMIIKDLAERAGKRI